MFPNALSSEEVAVLATIEPVSQGAGTVTTGWVNVANFEKFMALVDVGVVSTGTVDAKLQQAQDGSGTGSKDIPNKAITQITASAKQGIINLRDTELDVANNFCYVRLSLTVGTAATLIQAALLGLCPRLDLASTFNQAGVTSVIS